MCIVDNGRRNLILKPINNSRVVLKADTRSKNPETGEYKDPLMNWPLRGAAFTNEIGEALRPIIGGYATLTWAPALLYIGADVYDKYKNDQTDYDPDSKRGLKQALFQGLASVILPIFAVKGGQSLFSLFGLTGKEKITLSAQEQINRLAQQFVANGKLRAYKDRDAECIKEFIDIVDNNLDYKRQEEFASNPLKRIFDNRRVNKKENLDKYAKKTISKVIRTRKMILFHGSKIKENTLYKNYLDALEMGQTKNVAVKSVLNKYLDSKSLKGKAIKTLGGFLALGIAIKPIDLFVEEVLIGKLIGPGLDKKEKTG